MATVELTTEQIVKLVLQLPSERKREVLMALANDAQDRQDQGLSFAEEQLRQVCAARGLDWDSMTVDEREAFADDLIHED